jgi:hypothetical protein
MMRDKEAQPISILFFVLGIVAAFVVFFAVVEMGPGGTTTRFAQRADNWQTVTQLFRQENTDRNSRDL